MKPYKASIDRWLWPNVFKHQDTSVTKANKAIADYKKAIGHRLVIYLIVDGRRDRQSMLARRLLGA